ncbi:MAG: hypothetical protein JWO69_988 [Thermoleophilia bacterium]|nr:hypothetical protein [Thermoleophilia bacterium]
MTSPYASNLLQQPRPAETDAAPMPRPGQAPLHTRSVTHVQHQPQPVQYVQYAPQQPVYVSEPQSGRSGSAVSSLLLGLVVLLVGAASLVAAYYGTRQASPSVEEANLQTSIAAQSAYFQGRQRAIDAGRIEAVQASSTAGALRASIASSAAYDKAFQRGLAAGQKSYRAPAPYRGGGYRAPRTSFGGIGEVAGAFGIAQGLANSTGAPVDVEIYN